MIDLPVRAGNLSKAAMVLPTLLTMLPIATVGPVAGRSEVVDTVTPVADWATGAPMVAPVRVMVWGPAATSAVAATMYCGAVPLVAAAAPKLTPVERMVPLMYDAGKVMNTL